MRTPPVQRYIKRAADWREARLELPQDRDLTGWLWIITFVTSIPARFIFYGPVLEDGKDYVLGEGEDAMTFIAIGACSN